MLNLLLESGTKQEGTNWGSLIVFGLLIIGIIGLFIWQSISGKKKQQQAQEMVDSLKIGDRVKTIGGICGFVAQINNDENTFVLETGLEENKSYVKFDKGAIYQTAPAEGNANVKPAEEQKEEKVEEKVEEQPKEESKAKNSKAKDKE